MPIIDHIELHDSEVAFVREGDRLILRLCPAYVHYWERSVDGWVGEGRTQAAEISIEGGTVSAEVDGVVAISDGWLEVGGRRHDNLIQAPFSATGPVRARLELVDAPVVDITGQGVVIRFTGDPKFVEPLPAEWAPGDSAG